MRIELVIDELVLHGFEHRQRHGLADAVIAAMSSPEGSSELQAAIASWHERAPSAPGGARRTIATTPDGVGPAVAEAIGMALAQARPASPEGRHL